MKFFCICDNIDTQMGMRLAGIEGVIAHDPQAASNQLRIACEDEEIGIVLVTEKLLALCADQVYDIKQTRKFPLIVEIPDRHGSGQIGDIIDKYIRQAMGN
ncbi:MAG: V-type ATP synthase subunit F [Oscillospiraceae bacterium]|nr:V-type ATP synthase subunit F [Oscillospiraceae bacterium]